MANYPKLDRPEVLSHIFNPRAEQRTAVPPNGVDFDCPVEENVVLGCRFYGTDESAPTIIYFHGNGETVAEYDQIAGHYNRFGMNLLMTTYRGYGWSTGSPTATSMLNDAETVYTKALQFLEERGYNGPLSVMGRSLGSACAIDLVAKHQSGIKTLIIESGFGDTLPLAESLGIDISNTDITEDDCFRNCVKIEEITIPTLILHGAADSLIRPVIAEKLQSCSGARSKQFLLIPGADHSSTIATGGDIYFSTIKGFIDKACGVTKWGYKKRRK